MKIEGTVFTYNTIYGPHAGYVVTPPSWTTSDWDDLDAFGLKFLHGSKGARMEFSLIGECIINISQDIANRCLVF